MKRSYQARIKHTDDGITLNFANEKYVFGELKAAFADGCRVTVEVRSRKTFRSLPQNAYLHVLLQIIADDTGNDLESVKSTVKALYAKRPLCDRDGNEIFDPATGEQAMYVQDTHTMSTAEMLEFTENIRVFAREFLNIELPLPGDNLELYI